MRYIICDDCGGYYKLEDGESLEDFDACQCGGNLHYAQSFREIIKNRDVPKILCVHCGAENKESAITCSNCGEKLRKINRRVSDVQVKKPHKSQVKLMDRISFLGVFAGIVFLVIATIIAVLGLAGSIVSSNGVDILRSMGGYLLVMIFVIIASGFISGYISGAIDYVDGLLNGAMVGLALAVLSALFTMIMGMTINVAMGLVAGLITLVAYLFIYGSLTAFGGVISVWLRNNMEDY